jgi:hypothetical protein
MIKTNSSGLKNKTSRDLSKRVSDPTKTTTKQKIKIRIVRKRYFQNTWLVKFKKYCFFRIL